MTGPPTPTALPEAVARELAAATGRLPLAEREALALRELLGLSYDELARAPPGCSPTPCRCCWPRRAWTCARSCAAPARRSPTCDERERALRTIARRQDGEEVPAADDDWLIEHLGHCRGCRQAHAAMLEASACYRAWASPDVPADPVAGAASGS